MNVSIVDRKGVARYAPAMRFLKMTRRNFEVWLTYWRSSLVGNLLDPLFMLLGLGLGLGESIKEIGGMSYIQFIAPGIIASAGMYAATFECTFSAYTRMVPQKTFDSIMMTPMMLDDIVAGEILWGAVKGMESSLAILVVMALLPMGLTPSWWGLMVIPVSLLVCMMFASMALVYTSYSPSYDFFSYYFTLALTPQFLLSGIFFPLEDMPQWVQWLSEFMPLTHAVDLTRSLVMGWIHRGLWLDVFWIVGFVVVMFIIALRRMKKRMIN